MPSIRYLALNFPVPLGHMLAGHHDLDCTWSEMVWAAITVGKPGFRYFLTHRPFSMFEVVYKCFLLKTHLVERTDQRIGRSSVYDALDPSEKGAVSYFLGLVVAKLLAERLLRVAWLIHLDPYLHRIQPYTLRPSFSPDLIGRRLNRRWIVVEAKGRTNRFDAHLIRTAKTQALALSSIRGTRPEMNVSSISHFTNGVLEARWQDPRRPSGSRSVDISGGQLLRQYYEPFVTLVKSRIGDTSPRVIGDISIRTLQLPDADITVGLDERLLSISDFGRAAQDAARRASTVPKDSFKLGLDGVFVEAGPSWREDQMRKEPQTR